MKLGLFAILSFLLIASQVEARKAFVYKDPIILPAGDLRTLLSIAAGIADKKIVVADDGKLDLPIPFILMAPVSSDTVRKAIDAVILLEGYELVDAGAELELRTILTEKQCDDLNKALGRTRGKMPEKPLMRVRIGADGKAEPVEDPWLIIRAATKK